MRKVLAIIIPLFITFATFAQQTYYFSLADMFPIHDFQLEKSMNQGKNLRIVAIKENGEVNLKTEGKYEFVINGFLEKLNFTNGIAIIPEEISASILYVKHQSSTNQINHLYYYVAGIIIPIPFWLLIMIPIAVVLLAMVLKRLIILFLIIAFVLFFVLQGIDFSVFLNLIKESINSYF